MRGDDHVATLDLIERIIDALGNPGSYVGLASRAWEQPSHPDQNATVTTIRPRPVASLAPSRGAAVPVAVTHEAEFALCNPPQVGRPVGLRPHIERAFSEDAVTIDFAGFASETLAGCLGEPLDKVRSGRLSPSSVRLRILVPDTRRPWVLPCRIENLGDEPAFRARVAAIVDRSLASIVDSIMELRDLDIVADAAAEVRVYGLPPLFKLYLVNGREAFFGFYLIMEHTVRAQGGVHPMYDLMGKDSILFRHSSDDADGESAAAQFVAQAQMWFDSVWATVSQDYTRA